MGSLVMLERPSATRTLPVRLTEIRLDVRVAAAHRELAAGDDGVLLLAAAVQPSSVTYYVHWSAEPLLREIAA